MPRYDFKNLKTGEVDEYTMSWKELDKFKEDNQIDKLMYDEDQ